jgi:hypothetical protein
MVKGALPSGGNPPADWTQRSIVNVPEESAEEEGDIVIKQNKFRAFLMSDF